MQSKGVIKILSILIAIACIWQLAFTAVSYYFDMKADKYSAEAVEKFRATAEFNKISENDKAYVLDSVAKAKKRWFTDSVSNKKVYFTYTYKEVKAKEINLGLDLKGGMNVMLQVQLADLVDAMSGHNQSVEFQKALSLAKERSTNSGSDFITLFANAWKEVSNGKRLAQIFGTYEMRDRIKSETSDEEVLSIIRESSKSALANSLKVLRTRIDRFGVTQPSVQEMGNSGRILVELPGVSDPERVRKLLQGTAALEFWTTYTNQEISPFLVEANSVLASILEEDNPSVAVAEQKPSVQKDSADLLTSEISKSESNSGAEAQFKKNNPLFAVLRPAQSSSSACIGYAHASDTSLINKYLNIEQVKALFPAEFRPMWTVKPSTVEGGNSYELVAIKVATRDGNAPLDGDAVTSARVDYGGRGANKGTPAVSMTMSAEGANIWARLTKDNLGKQIAIVLDGLVYSYPVVQSEITGGSSSITGHFTVEEATDLANVLESGKLPASAKIVQEQVVGPSLGARSIQAGMISFVLAFVLVLLYMMFFYSRAGWIADFALLCNVVFLFGVLVSFGAVLTLPGIAGLVLTMGMAVDANVIIYERIKEELAAGKGLGKAIADGYSNAYSAIIDGQVTTLLTGIVLFYFGSGPIQGFATTLIIGIITSVLTSIFITRLIFENRVARGKGISFDNPLSRNFLKNTTIDFLGKRKISYVVSGLLILVSVVSISVKGFTYGVDFTGGRTYIIRFDNPVVVEEIRSATEAEFNESVEVKQFGGESQMKVTTKYKIEDESPEVDKEVEMKLYSALKRFFANENMTFDEFISTQDNPNGIISSDKIGPTIANDIKRSAVLSVLLSLFVIFAYIAVRFKGWTWGLGGVVSLAHTAIIVIGFFSLFTGILPFNLDVDQTFIAAILTIIGYAINDNVVIFDRIREHKMLHPKEDMRTVVNSAINATLTRTINTSCSTLVTMVAIALFGGESIRGLAVALVLGIIIGAYASIFIGTPVMYDVSKYVDAKKSK